MRYSIFLQFTNMIRSEYSDYMEVEQNGWFKSYTLELEEHVVTTFLPQEQTNLQIKTICQ